jgi:hypothetical protein
VPVQAMKKISLILLILIYSISSFGIGIKQFYCCGKLESTTLSFLQVEKKKCDKDDGTSGCCKTEFKSFKIKDSHVAAADISAPGTQIAELYLTVPVFEILALSKQTLVVANAAHAPPLQQGIPIYILDCTYRI